jgi:hypothetical protein
MVDFSKLDRAISESFAEVVQGFGQTLPEGVRLQRTDERTATITLTPEQFLAHEGYTTVDGEMVSADRWSERLIQDFDFEQRFVEALNGTSI